MVGEKTAPMTVPFILLKCDVIKCKIQVYIIRSGSKLRRWAPTLTTSIIPLYSPSHYKTFTFQMMYVALDVESSYPSILLTEYIPQYYEIHKYCRPGVGGDDRFFMKLWVQGWTLSVIGRRGGRCVYFLWIWECCNTWEHGVLREGL